MALPIASMTIMHCEPFCPRAPACSCGESTLVCVFSLERSHAHRGRPRPSAH